LHTAAHSFFCRSISELRLLQTIHHDQSVTKVERVERKQCVMQAIPCAELNMVLRSRELRYKIVDERERRNTPTACGIEIRRWSLPVCA
jgi:hypothetical protein